MPPEEEAALPDWLVQQGLANTPAPAAPPANISAAAGQSTYVNATSWNNRRVLTAEQYEDGKRQLGAYIATGQLRIKKSIQWDDRLTHAHVASLRGDELDQLLYYVLCVTQWVQETQRLGFPEPAHPYVRFVPTEKEIEETMLEQLLKLYTMYMATGVTSPMPHFVGPPGSGKSTVFRQLAEMLGVRVFTVNVSRISPLELEGVQMPDKENTQLTLLHNPMWKQLREGDIVLLDEFLRGFPEVYNGLLDILTSREVAGLHLPKVFIAGASNSTVAYDKALEDRLLHIKVPDPRVTRSGERGRLAWMIIDQLGLNPAVKSTTEMDDLFAQEVLPMFEILDSFDGTGMKASAGQVALKGTSVRKLIGQAQLRHVTSRPLKALIEQNNLLSNKPGKHQYVFLLSGDKVPAGYKSAAETLAPALDKLTEIQRINREMNLQLISMQEAKASATTREDTTDDDPF